MALGLQRDIAELLGVVGGEADENDEADDGDEPAHRIGLEEEVDEDREEEADHAHDEEGAHRGEVAAW